MKKILSLLALLSLAVVLTGCTEDNTGDTSPITIVSSDTEFNSPGGEGVISFDAKARPKVESNEEWLTIGSITDTDVTFSVDTNESMSGRGATVTLTVDNKSQEVSVWQSGSIFNLGVLSLTLGAEAEEKVLDVNTYIDNSGITISTGGATWLDVTLADNKVTFKPTLNNSAERSTVVSFDLGSRVIKLDVKQLDRGYVDNYDVVIPREGTAKITAQSALNSVTSAWIVSSAGSWLTASRNGNTIDLSAAPAPNNTGSANTTTVSITGSSQTLAVINVRYEIYSYDFYLGPWTMVYGNTNTELAVELKVNVQGESYKMELDGFDVIVDYDHWTGNLSLVYQYLGQNADDQYVHLCPGDGSYYTWKEGVGFDLVYNRNEASNAFTFTDNGVWGGGSEATNFSLIGFDTITPAAGGNTEIASYPRLSRFYR